MKLSARAAVVSRCNKAGKSASKLTHVAAGKLQLLSKLGLPTGLLHYMAAHLTQHQGSPDRREGKWKGEEHRWERKEEERGEATGFLYPNLRNDIMDMHG